MKKLLIILLAALLLVSFTSCNQDKIDELEKRVAEQEKEKETLTKENETLKSEKEAIVKNYEDFVDAYTLRTSFQDAYSTAITTDADNNVSVNFATEGTTTPSIKDILKYFVTLEEEETISTVTVSDATGTISGTYKTKSNSPTEATLKFTDNSFKVKYTTDKVSEEREVTITVDGDYSIKNTTAKSEMSFKMTINGKVYDMSFVKDLKTHEFTSAKANGQDVELVLLNKNVRTWA